MMFWTVTQSLLNGLATTFEIFILTLLFALPLGLILAFGSRSKLKPLRYLVQLLVWIIRGTPLMLQLIIIFYGPGLWLGKNIWSGNEAGRIAATVVAFSLNYACYFSVIFRGGMESIPAGQKEAGQVLGMTRSQIFFKITLLQMVKRVILFEQLKEQFIEKAYLTRGAIMEQLNQKSIKYNWHEADASVMEGILARGDRRLCKPIMEAYKKGCIFDAWGEYYKHDVWMETFEECGIDTSFYTTRERDLDEIFPWDFIDCGVTKDFLKKEWLKALDEEVTKNCKVQCNACGASKFKCGVCTEPHTDI